MEYSDFADMFFPDIINELAENININKHAIKLVNNKQLPYRHIYIFILVEFEILKAYIKTHLKTGFIQPLKSLAGIPIMFNKKPNKIFYLYVDY